MPEFISNTLTHWTGRDKPDTEAFEVIEKIINTKKLLLTYCPNYPRLPENRQIRTMMVCFTDIPLHLSQEHCARFGKFGIGFSKDKMIQYGANPVLYTTREMNERVEKFISLIGRLQSEEVDREWRDSALNADVGDRYQFLSEQFFAMFEIAGFMQNYQYSDTSIDYYQREWRINYETLPKALGMEPQVTPGQGAIYGSIGTGERRRIACSMLFDLDDIDYIIVPREYEEQARNLTNDLRAEVKIYEDEVG
ncbi:MAG: abortive infection system antitoxin AbiGi family protein [Bacteroidaceae bacterium]|nr:abortive infection system antitoxin AbiGi family protein [Petrimonas sp.]MEA4967751.1 abortive infection system antitoxin AbiGi family protein [Bacteroidaceae bacterium]